MNSSVRNKAAIGILVAVLFVLWLSVRGSCGRNILASQVPLEPAAVAQLVAELKDPDLAKSAGAARKLKLLGEMLKDPLVGSRFPDVKPIVMALGVAAKSDHEGLRYNATEALAAFGPEAESAVPDLAKAVVAEKDDHLRGKMIDALGSISFGAKAAVPVLMGRLKSGDDQEVLVAARALAKVGAAAVPELMTALNSPDKKVRWEAINALREIGAAAKESLPMLLQAASSADAELRFGAVGAIASIAEPKTSIPVLIKALEDNNAGIQKRAAEEVEKLGPLAEEAVPALAKAFAGSGFSNYAMAKALGKIGRNPGAAVPALIKALDTKDRFLQETAIGALGEFGEESAPAVPALSKLLTAKSKSAASLAATTLGKIGPKAKDAVPILVKCLDDGFVRAAAAGALGGIGPDAKDAVEPLRQAVKKGTNAESIKELRPKAALALWQICKDPDALVRLKASLVAEDKIEANLASDLLAGLGQDALTVLQEALKEPKDYMRWSAATTLGKMGAAAKPSVPALLLALDDKNAGVQVIAAAALWKIAKHDKAVPALRQALLKPEFLTDARRTIQILGEIGPEAKAAVPEIRPYLYVEGDESTRFVAGKALKKIDPEFAKKLGIR